MLFTCVGNQKKSIKELSNRRGSMVNNFSFATATAISIIVVYMAKHGIVLLKNCLGKEGISPPQKDTIVVCWSEQNNHFVGFFLTQETERSENPIPLFDGVFVAPYGCGSTQSDT
jgi:hypothetical protein